MHDDAKQEEKKPRSGSPNRANKKSRFHHHPSTPPSLISELPPGALQKSKHNFFYPEHAFDSLVSHTFDAVTPSDDIGPDPSRATWKRGWGGAAGREGRGGWGEGTKAVAKNEYFFFFLLPT